jgi:Flp pilus assembly protein TadG
MLRLLICFICRFGRMRTDLPPRSLKRLWLARSGSVALHFGLMIVPVVGLSGGAVDLAEILRARALLDSAADASAVASVAIDSPAAIAAASMTSNGVIAVGATDAAKVFNANTGDVGKYATITYAATVQKSGLQMTSAVSYTAVLQTNFTAIIGIPSWTIVGSAQAQSNLSPYIDFYLLLDNTPSMAIAATQSGINTMVSATANSSNSNEQSCAFACHQMDESPNDLYGLAKTLGVQKRIDVVSLAAQDLMTTAQSSEPNSGQFRVAIYTFGATAATAGLTTVAALNSNLATVRSQASTVDVMTVPSERYNNDMDTDFDGVLSALNTKISTPGDGASSSAPQKVVMFVSDGVADAQYPSTCTQPLSTQSRCQEPLNTTICTTMKNRGIKVAVLYTTYYPLPTNDWYGTWIAPFSSQIAANMQACASPGLYFEVSPSQGIPDAMTALFLQSLQTVRMTQ